MTYSQRKMYIAQRKAKMYRIKAMVCNIFVAVSAINIFGSCLSVLNSPIYFLLNSAVNVIIIRICYMKAANLEIKSQRVLKDCKRKLKKLRNEAVDDNIIYVDFSSGKYPNYKKDNINSEII